MKQILEVRLKGGLLLGGGPVAGVNDATVRDHDGLPFIPAAALKGAIREQLRRLVNDAEQTDAILGGEGVRPLPDEEHPAAEERPGGGSTRVFLSDACLRDEASRELFKSRLGYTTKAQVSIDRRSGRAARDHLFHREVVAPFAAGLCFVADLDLTLLDAQKRREFAAAVSAVFALGAARTSGLGGVEMRIVDREDEGEVCPLPDTEGADADAVVIELEALDPVNVGPDRVLGNFRRSLGHVPASTLRGAVVTAALHQRGLADKDRSDEPWFHQLVLDPDRCLRFSDALPVTGDARPMPSPVTLRACKVKGPCHGVRDTLIRDYFCTLLSERGVFVVPDDRCPAEQAGKTVGEKCNARLVPHKRPLGSDDPERRIVTRLGLDAGAARGADRQLFSLELLERGTRFVATVAGLDHDGGRELLADAARSTLRVGHGRGQGYGRMRICRVEPAPASDLDARLTAFDEEVRSGLRCLADASLAAAPDERDRYFAATLTSELVPAAPGPAEDAVVAALGLDGVEVVYAQLRTGQRGGWDARAGRPKAYQGVVCAGSVLLLRTARPFADLMPRLAELEVRGVGTAREEGFGWVRFSDPIHLSTRRTP